MKLNKNNYLKRVSTYPTSPLMEKNDLSKQLSNDNANQNKNTKKDPKAKSSQISGQEGSGQIMKNATIFLGGIPIDFQPSDLLPYFENFGEIQALQFKKRKQSDLYNLGFGYMQADPLVTAKILSTPFHSVKNRRIECKPFMKKGKGKLNYVKAKTEKTIYAYGIPMNWKLVEVKKFFQKFGKIENLYFLPVYIQSDKADARYEKILGQRAFLLFEDEKAANNLIVLSQKPDYELGYGIYLHRKKNRAYRWAHPEEVLAEKGPKKKKLTEVKGEAVVAPPQPSTQNEGPSEAQEIKERGNDKKNKIDKTTTAKTKPIIDKAKDKAENVQADKKRSKSPNKNNRRRDVARNSGWRRQYNQHQKGEFQDSQFEYVKKSEIVKQGSLVKGESGELDWNFTPKGSRSPLPKAEKNTKRGEIFEGRGGQQQQRGRGGDLKQKIRSRNPQSNLKPEMHADKNENTSVQVPRDLDYSSSPSSIEMGNQSPGTTEQRRLKKDNTSLGEQRGVDPEPLRRRDTTQRGLHQGPSIPVQSRIPIRPPRPQPSPEYDQTRSMMTIGRGGRNRGFPRSNDWEDPEESYPHPQGSIMMESHIPGPQSSASHDSPSEESWLRKTKIKPTSAEYSFKNTDPSHNRTNLRYNPEEGTQKKAKRNQNQRHF